MRKHSRMNYIFCVLVILFAACKKNETISQTFASKPETPTVETPPNPVAAGPSYSKTYEVGTGSGDLVINGSAYTLGGTVLFKIKGGSYKSIKIANIDAGSNGLVTIQNNGLVEMVNAEMRLENLNGVVLSGNGTSGIEKGFVFRDNSYRAIQVDGTINNFTLQYVSFKNIADYVFTYKYQKVYDGSASSYSQNLRFLYIDCDNTSTFFAGDGGVAGQIVGLLKKVEIAYLNFKNSPSVGSVVYFGNVEDADLHNNTINNINTSNNNHNGIFMVKGNGKFYNNYITNHQGNAIRAWLFSVGSSPKSILIYNNIVFNSRKYSPFEVQSFDTDIRSGVTTYANAKIFYNTAGNINTSSQWQGNMVDVYSLKGGSCDVYNNLAFNFKNQDTEKVYFAGQQSDLKATESNNLYFNNSKDAGLLDEAKFKLSATSAAKSNARYDSSITTDFYGVTRSNTPSVGAVE